MTQEEIIDNKVEEADNPDDEINEELPPEEKQGDEKLKRVLLIVLILALFGGTYYYYNKLAQHNTVIIAKKEQVTASKVSAMQKIEQSVKNEVSPLLSSVTNIKQGNNQQEAAVTNQKTNKIPETVTAVQHSYVIKVSAKDSLKKLAMESKGKTDPFEGMVGKTMPDSPTSAKSIANLSNLPNIKLNSLPQVPFFKPNFSSKGLPSVGNFNNFNSLNNNDAIEIKGFIANKVIVDVNGLVESLGINESFQDIKVLNIDKTNLTAKFKKDNRVITKNMKSLTSVDNEDDIQLIKNIKN